MSKITDKFTDKLRAACEDHTKKVAVLNEIIRVDWDNLPVDTVLIASNELAKLAQSTNSATSGTWIRHYAGRTTEDGFATFSHGQSSQTNNSGTETFSYAMPLAAYKRIFP